MMRERLIRRYREGLGIGRNPVVSEHDAVDSVGFDFEIHRIASKRFHEHTEKETVWLLMQGEATISGEHVSRRSIFDEPPSALHVPADSDVSIESSGETEWAVARVTNDSRFAPRFFLPHMLSPEYRGKGLAQDMCLRNVRLVFDWNARPESKLVVGEVVNYPGRWSSYPPHHHAQPELYHYRFTEPQGYGHAELGEHVLKVGQYDSIKIMGGEDHAQVSAPGYGMYYLWIVRHLDQRPYRGFEFAPEHQWMLDPKNQGWRPKDGD